MRTGRLVYVVAGKPMMMARNPEMMPVGVMVAGRMNYFKRRSISRGRAPFANDLIPVHDDEVDARLKSLGIELAEEPEGKTTC